MLGERFIQIAPKQRKLPQPIADFRILTSKSRRAQLLLLHA